LQFIIKKQYLPKKIILGFYLGNDFRDNFFGMSLNFAHTEKENKNEILLKAKIIKILKSSKLITETYHAFRNFVDLISSEPSMRSYTVSEIYSYLINPNDKFKIAINKTNAAFQILKNMSDKYGFEVIVVGIPSKAQVYKSFKEITHYENDNKARLVALDAINNGFDFDRPDKVVKKLSNKFDFQYISLLNHFRRHSSEKIYYFIDSHWNYKGQELAANLVSDFILKNSK